MMEAVGEAVSRIPSKGGAAAERAVGLVQRTMAAGLAAGRSSSAVRVRGCLKP